MKKIFALILVFTMVIALVACGETDDTPSGDNNPGSSQGEAGGSGNSDNSSIGGGETSAFEAPLLDLLGLTDLAPAGVTKKEVTHDWANLHKGEYNFHAPVSGDPAQERMEYANKVLAAIQGISDDGKAYRDVYTATVQGWIIAEPYTAGIDTSVSGMPGYYFYKDGMVISLTIQEEGNATEHRYNIFIQKEADDYIQYNGN